MAEKNFHGEKSFARKKIENFSYGLEDKIGKGYSSQVYRGKNDNLDEPVAIKVIDLKMLKSEINRILLASEIEILKSMKNMSHILNFHEVYTTKNNAYIITELCETDLDFKIKKGLTEGEALSYMDQIITGYSHIFKKDLIHRDLKPANLLISKSSEIKIADFGFVVKSADVIHPSKYNVGSPLYMAPESMRRNEYSFKSDIWALGIILFEMLTGETPWKAKNEKELLRKIESEKIDEVLMRYSFDKQVNKFLSQTLCQDKNHRIKPEELIQFSFKSPSLGNILEEKSSNIIPQNFSAAYPSSSQKKISYSEKSIEKRMFTVEKPSKAFNQKTPSTYCENFSLKKIENTQKNVENSQKNTYVTTVSSSERTDSSMIQKEDKKQISKLLITEVHFCRFLYKMYVKIKESMEVGLFKDNIRIDVLFKCFGKIVSEKMTNLKEFEHFNYVMVDSNKYSQYKNTPDFVKLSKVVKDYFNRYSEEFGSFWHNTDKKAQKQVLYRESIEEVSKSIQFLLINLQEKSNGEFIGDCGRFLNGFNKDIVILDYLITCKQLLEIIDKEIRVTGCENYEKFTRKSRIEEIVDGGTSEISLELYEKIIERGRIIVGRI